MSSPKKVFVREATGLIRAISPFNAFVTTVALTNIGIGFALLMAFIPYVWPDANMPLAFVLVLPFLLLHSALCILMMRSMPRSGGDYVWTGRILHPAIASASYIVFIVFGALSNGAFLNAAVSYGLNSMFVSVGLISGNSGLVDWSTSTFGNPLWITLLGTLVLVYAIVVLIFGVSFYLKQQIAAWAIGIIGTVAVMVLFATTTSGQFAASFDSVMKPYTTYQDIITKASSSGFTPPAFSLFATLSAMAFTWFANVGYQSSAYWSGEMKNVDKGAVWSTIGNNVFSTAVLASGAYLFVNAVGSNWLSSISYLAYGQPSQYTIPVIINPYFLASVISNNLALAILINLAMFLWVGFLWLPPIVMQFTRVLFGISFDRILPTSLADVNDRFHSPVKGIILIGVLMWIGMLGSLYYGVIVANLNTTLVYSIVYAIVGLAAAAFPFTLKSVYNSSGLARFKIGSIPIITVLGILTFIFFAFLVVDVGLNPVIGGPSNPIALATLAVSLLVGGSVYFISRAYHKREGIDIAMSFKQLPPE